MCSFYIIFAGYSWDYNAYTPVANSTNNGPATAAAFMNPVSVWGAKDGTMFILDGDLREIRKIDRNGACELITAFFY